MSSDIIPDLAIDPPNSLRILPQGEVTDVGAFMLWGRLNALFGFLAVQRVSGGLGVQHVWENDRVRGWIDRELVILTELASRVPCNPFKRALLQAMLSRVGGPVSRDSVKAAFQDALKECNPSAMDNRDMLAAFSAGALLFDGFSDAEKGRFRALLEAARVRNVFTLNDRMAKICFELRLIDMALEYSELALTPPPHRIEDQIFGHVRFDTISPNV